jgi:hypothetical protein
VGFKKLGSSGDRVGENRGTSDLMAKLGMRFLGFLVPQNLVLSGDDQIHQA